MRPSYLTSGVVPEEQMLQWLHEKARRARMRRALHRWAGIAFIAIAAVLFYQACCSSYEVLFG